MPTLLQLYHVVSCVLITETSSEQTTSSAPITFIFMLPTSSDLSLKCKYWNDNWIQEEQVLHRVW